MTLTLLKLIALVSMLIDHLGSAFSPTGWNVVADPLLMRQIGRIAFPLYAFCSVYGCLHTRRKVRYIRWLAIEAILSAIPYTLAFTDKPGLVRASLAQDPSLSQSTVAFSWNPTVWQLLIPAGLCAVLLLIGFSRSDARLPAASCPPESSENARREWGITAFWVMASLLVSSVLLRIGPFQLLEDEQNVIYTFLIGVCAITLIEERRQLSVFEGLCGLVGVGVMFFYLGIRSDYGLHWDGLFLMACFYLVSVLSRWLQSRPSAASPALADPSRRSWRFNLASALCVLAWVYYCMSHQILNERYWPWMAVPALFLLFFHPKKTPYPTSLRLLFYSFYPVHLALIGCINLWMVHLSL